MRRIITYQPTLGETMLLILDEILSATVATFYPHPYYHKFCSHAHPRSIYRSLKLLERRYLIGARRRGGKEEWCLTPEGEKLVRRLKLRFISARQKHWDGKWRLVIFDVPERIRDRRNFLRRELDYLGFHQLQKSAWVTPYPLPLEFFEITKELEVDNHFRVITADSIEHDRDLRNLFFPKV